MVGLSSGRIALIVARHVDHGAHAQEAVATGYFLTGDLVLTAGHIADRPNCEFDVRADVDGLEKNRWSKARSVWTGVGDVDAMLLRTTRSFGDWVAPTFGAISGSEDWESMGYPGITADKEKINRKTFPLNGSAGLSEGQGPSELALTTNQEIASGWENYWRGISGAPIFSRNANDTLVGIVTDANRATSNGLIGLPAVRLFDEIHFRSIISPSFLPQLPSSPWCLVVTSEGEGSDLVEQVAPPLAGFQNDEEVLRLQKLHENLVEISVLDAIRSVENWAATVEALARADYLIADVTSFEPAVMLLLGIRSVLRRGVTVSVTARDLEEHVSETPFNVQETKVLSHKDEHFYGDLRWALTQGAANLAQDSNYLDLPAYHAVRAPRPMTWAQEDGKSLLVLCPFDSEYKKRYKKYLLSKISGYSGGKKPLRMLDLQSPRLVGQALYEQIRWSTYCIVDWTGWRPNVFFELGVRLACSERDPICLIDQIDLDSAQPLSQHALLRELFAPVPYDQKSSNKVFEKALESFREKPDPGGIALRHARGDVPPWGTVPPGGTFAVAQASFQWRHDRMLTRRPDIEQRERAEQILGKDQEQRPERLILFANNEHFDAELVAAVREKWIAAWLYLRYLSASEGADQDGIRTEAMRIGQMLLRALKLSDDPRHGSLRDEIDKWVNP